MAGKSKISFLRKIPIFNIEKCDDGYDKITILGIKIRRYNTKNACKNMYHRLIINTLDFTNSMWEANGPREDLLKYFEFISHSPHAWQFYHCHFWLIYLSCLIETGDNQKAKNILRKYIQCHNLLDIERYLPVAKFTKEQGYSNKRIDDACIVMDRLVENRKNKLFEKLIEGKTVAIVGNGPSEIGKGKGSEIDSHDIVIRMNNYQIKGFEKDYGSKTNIWIKCSNDDIKHDIRDENINLIVYEPDYIHHRVIDGYLRAMVNSPKDIDYFDFNDHACLREKLGIFPSTGLVAIEKIMNTPVKSLKCYGFHFLQEKQDGYATHYFNDRNENKARAKSLHHSFDVEAEYLKEMMNFSMRRKENDFI